MYYELYLFYVFSSFAIISSIMVVSLANAVHSVLFLIIVFCNIAGILILLGVEFFAFLLLIVYVGAIAVLFLFVVMMLNVKMIVIKSNMWSNFILVILITLTFIFQFFITLSINFETVDQISHINYFWTDWILKNDALTNIEVIGNVLYTKYSFIFLISGFILLIAMIGAIVLTMHQRSNLKKQLISVQLVRNPLGGVKFINV